MRLFLDTARMGPACPRASQALCEFARLAAEDPSLYSLAFLKHGAEAWPDSVRITHSELARWQGIANLRRLFAESFSYADSEHVLLANRTAQLLRLSARLMFRQCRHVLTTDMSWPAWQAIVNAEAIRQGRRVTQIPLAQAVLNERWSAENVLNHIAHVCQQIECDGLFLPAISNLGISVPASALVSTLRTQQEVRFVLVDAAQAYCQIPVSSLAEVSDVTIVGCHKWLGAHLPMGVAIAGNRHVAEQLRCIIRGRQCQGSLNDPLLAFSEQLLSGRVDRYSETVNVTPMLSANAALSAGRASRGRVNEAFEMRRCNLERAVDCFAGTAWQPIPVHESLRSAILLGRSKESELRRADPDVLQARFRDAGVALSAYRDGLIRLSMPSQPLAHEQMECLAGALKSVSG